MKTIYKYTIKVSDYFNLILPKGAQLLDLTAVPSKAGAFVTDSALVPTGEIDFWAVVDSNEDETETIRGRIFGTGHPFDADVDEYPFVGTVRDGPFVWHVFLEE